MSDEERVHHPWFARAYMRSQNGADEEYRRALLTGLSGRVIEVGSGHGPNFDLYPPSVSYVLAVEPEPLLREAARKRAAGAATRIKVVDGVAERLPAGDAEFDAGVVSLVLCSVPDQARALSELHRVIRPGGELRFYEHVASQGRMTRRLQRLVDATVWPRVAGGCHLARDTRAAIEGAGFEIEDCRRFSFSPCAITPGIPHILGRARRP